MSSDKFNVVVAGDKVVRMVSHVNSKSRKCNASSEYGMGAEHRPNQVRNESVISISLGDVIF